MKRILVTGGAGFIGSHLVEALIERGDHVIVLDDFSTGKREVGTEIIKENVMNTGVLQEIMPRVHQVYHLAAIVGVRNVAISPLATLDVNVLGTNNVLKQAALAQKKVLLASSSEAYGDSPAQEYYEFAASRIEPVTASYRSVYGLSKLMGEQMAYILRMTLGMKTVVARIFNTIGPRQSGAFGMVVPRFVENAIKGIPLEVYNGGEQIRTFIDVRDTVRALIELMDSDVAEGGVFNVGGTRPITIYELAKKICKLADSDAPIQNKKFPYAGNFSDFKRRVPNTTKIKDLIGFEPKIPLEETLADTIAFFRDQLKPRLVA